MEISNKGVEVNWIQNTLDEINAEFKQKQRKREASQKENGSLDDFNGWMVTANENHKIKLLAKATEHYKDMRGVPGKVMKFARRFVTEENPRKFKVMNTDTDDIMSYIDHSQYWQTESKTVSGVKIIYAQNDDMQCVICYFKNKFIITTASSFKHILEDIEVKLHEGNYEGKLQHLPKKRATHRYESSADDFRQPWVHNHLDMDKYTF